MILLSFLLSFLFFFGFGRCTDRTEKAYVLGAEEITEPADKERGQRRQEIDECIRIESLTADMDGQKSCIHTLDEDICALTYAAQRAEEGNVR